MAIFLAALAAVATIGRPERAARLFAAEARLERLGMRIQPPDVAQHLRNVAEVRAVLDDATFARAWTEGSSMSLDQALADVQTAARLAFAEEHPPANRTAPPDWREREVAALIAERTPYKHVANMPSKRNFASHAKLAVWAADLAPEAPSAPAQTQRHSGAGEEEPEEAGTSRQCNGTLPFGPFAAGPAINLP